VADEGDHRNDQNELVAFNDWDDETAEAGSDHWVVVLLLAEIKGMAR
jgi:hypothetical protein